MSKFDPKSLFQSFGGNKQEFDSAYYEGFERVRRLELQGPDRRSLPTVSVHSIEEFVETCNSQLADGARAGEAVFRGQTQDYTLADGISLSLLPALARPPQKCVSATSAMERAFLIYMREVTTAHMDAIATSKAEADLLLEVATKPHAAAADDGKYMFSRTPLASFIWILLAQTRQLDLFEAALQHYGFPTLMLDVTHSPLVALFFATHKIERKNSSAYRWQSTGGGGVVYLMRPPAEMRAPREEIALHPELLKSYASRPRFVDLFEVSWDNDSRPRRQYAALLTGLRHVDLSMVPQLNDYAFGVVSIIQLAEGFWKHPSTRRFLEADMAGWLFPGPKIDLLLRSFRRAAPKHFPRYQLGNLQLCSDPRGKFEFLQPLRIVLTGSDTRNVARLLANTWHGRRAGLIEILSHREVLRRARDAGEPNPMDIVVVCEPDREKMPKLCNQILKAGARSGRFFVVMNANVGRARGMAGLVDDVLFVLDNDEYDQYLQRRLLEAQLMVSRYRYDERMKPAPAKWESFLPQSFGVCNSRSVAGRGAS